MYSRLNQLHGHTKDKFENLLNKNGMDLIKEWGFMSKKAKPTIVSGNDKIEESKTGKCSTPKLTTKKSLSANTEKVKKPTDPFGASLNSSKLKDALRKNKSNPEEEKKSEEKKASALFEFY